jgi:hypothetical protein
MKRGTVDEHKAFNKSIAGILGAGEIAWAK